MRTIALALLLVASSAAIADAEQVAARPPDIAAENWIPISESVGFVVTKEDASKFREFTIVNSLSGYFVARRGKHWVRLETESFPKLQKVK